MLSPAVDEALTQRASPPREGSDSRLQAHPSISIRPTFFFTSLLLPWPVISPSCRGTEASRSQRWIRYDARAGQPV